MGRNKSSLRDLGVRLENNLNFNEHINQVCKTAKIYCDWVLWTFKSRYSYLVKTLWNSMILPCIDYCQTIWLLQRSCQPRWLSGLRRIRVHSLWLLVDHCVLRNWDRILVRAVKGLISRAGMVSICPLLWQRDVKLQQTNIAKKLLILYSQYQRSELLG